MCLFKLSFSRYWTIWLLQVYIMLGCDDFFHRPKKEYVSAPRAANVEIKEKEYNGVDLY